MYITPEIRHLDRTEHSLPEFSSKNQGQNLSPTKIFTAPEYVFGGSGACLMLSMNCINEVSFPKGLLSKDESFLLDPDFFAYREDAELALRMQWLGWKTIYMPNSTAFHMRRVRPENRAVVPPEINSMSVRNRFLLQGNGITFPLLLLTFPSSFFRNILVILGCFFKEQTSIPGLKEVFHLRARTLEKRKWIFANKQSSTLTIFNWFKNDFAFPPALTKPKENTDTAPIKKLCAIIINYNQADELRSCVDSILNSSAQLETELEILIVNNSADDPNFSKLKEDLDSLNLPTIKFLEPNTNLGFSGGINKAHANTSLGENDLLLVLNPDVTLENDTISNAINCFCKHDNLGALSPILVDKETKEVQTKYFAKKFPRLLFLFSELFALQKIVPNNSLFRFQHYLDDNLLNAAVQNKDGLFEVEQLAGACLFIRNSSFTKLKGFDETFYPAWHEDVDFSIRLYKEKVVSAVLCSSIVLHQGGTSTKSIARGAFIHIFYKNYLTYWIKHSSTNLECILGCWLLILTFFTKKLLLVDFNRDSILESIKNVLAGNTFKETYMLIHLCFKNIKSR